MAFGPSFAKRDSASPLVRSSVEPLPAATGNWIMGVSTETFAAMKVNFPTHSRVRLPSLNAGSP
jgi:hypothetical protein